MNRFRDELRVIPQVAWAIAAIVLLFFPACVWLLVIPRDENMSAWPQWGMVLFSAGFSFFLAVYALLIGYVNGDARRRGMRYVMWTLLALFIPNTIGVILYFILRDPLLRGCANCGTMVSQGFAFCSKCGKAMTQSCPECRTAVQPEWSHCTKCGARLHGA